MNKFLILFMTVYFPLYCMETTETVETSVLALENRLDDIAINQQCGYKAANLIILKELCTTINSKKTSSYAVAVPYFGVIPSDKIQRFFSTYSIINIAARWKNIIDEYFPNDEIKKTTLSSQQFPDNFLSTCNQFAEELKLAHIQLTEQTIQRFSFNKFFQLENQDIDQCIAVVTNKNEKLMVRSSGKEDTKTLANAGGNATIANVTPAVPNILKALQTVVASYFNETSLIQRLGAGDNSLFDSTPPLTPIIIQRMIHSAGEMPTRCGVMFTEETEGGIAKYGEKQTTGITVIQTAYGHNEGVVNSLIPVDTYYITNDNNIFPIIRPKTYRMFPTKESGVLVRKKNDPDIIDTSSLTKEMVSLLKLISTELENSYGNPMDIEFVVNDDEKIIYIVQARPLVYNQKTMQPSYIINPASFDNDKKLTGTSIGIAGGSLRHCTNQNEIIVAETINQALAFYQQLKGPEKKDIKCIVVGTMAPITSHEATSFRSESKPVLYVQNWQIIKEWLKNSSINIIISPQQSLIINTYDQNIPIDQLINKKIATLGWVSYPMEHYLSLIDEFDPHLKIDGRTIARIMPKITEIELRKSFENISRPWSETLHTIKMGNELEARIALAQLLYEIRTIIQKQSTGIELDEDLQQKIAHLESYLIYCALHIAPTLQIVPTNIQYPQRLFGIRILENLLYQQPLLHEIVNGYSVATVIAKELTEEKNIIQSAQQQKNLLTEEKNITVDPISIQLMRIKQFAITPNLETLWNNFITQLAKPENATIKKRFAGFVKVIATLNILPLWLNTSFAQKITKSNDLVLLTNSFFAEYITQQDFLTIIQEKKEKIASFNSQNFADPQLFSSQWNIFNKELLQYFISKQFLTSFQNANAFGQLAAINLMSQFVEMFDNAIKAVTGRTNNTNNEEQLAKFYEEKVTHFRTMLLGYARLFEQWITLTPQDSIEQFLGLIRARISIMQRNLSRKPINPIKEFDASSDFNVGIFTIGSGIGKIQDIYLPKTYEDVFTTIHQCLLVTISALTRTNDLIQNISLPEPLNNLSTMIQTIHLGEHAIAKFIGIAVTSTSMELTYSLSLRNHGMHIVAKQSKKNPETSSLTITFYGKNEEERWDKAKALASMISNKNIAPVIATNITQISCTITFLINQQTPLEELKNLIETLADYVTGPSFNTNPTALKNYASFIKNNIESIDNVKLGKSILQEIEPLLQQQEHPNEEEAQPITQAQQKQINPTQPTQAASATLVSNIKNTFSKAVNAIKSGFSWITNTFSNLFKR